jgi:hypothetical protein
LETAGSYRYHIGGNGAKGTHHLSICDGFVLLSGVPIVAVVKDPKLASVLMLWKEGVNRRWTRYAEIPDISFPSVFCNDDTAIGVVGSGGRDVRSG